MLRITERLSQLDNNSYTTIENTYTDPPGAVFFLGRRTPCNDDRHASVLKSDRFPKRSISLSESTKKSILWQYFIGRSRFGGKSRAGSLIRQRHFDGMSWEIATRSVIEEICHSAFFAYDWVPKRRHPANVWFALANPCFRWSNACNPPIAARQQIETTRFESDKNKVTCASE